jgi:membrane fusion protein (multidrug efflux system)
MDGSPHGNLLLEGIMYVERDQDGAFSRVITAPTQGRPANATAAPATAQADPAEVSADTLEGRNRPDQEPVEQPAVQPKLLPVPVAKETPRGQARNRSFRLGRRALLGAVALLILGAAGDFGYRYWTVGRFIQTTDDAYVSAHNTTLAAKVAGYVATIAVDDNTRVRAGDVIATIDDGDFKLAVASARDKAATEQATVDRIGRQIVAQQASVDQAKAQLASAQANSTQRQLELERQHALSQREFASRQTLEQAQSNRDQAVAAVDSAQAGLAAAVANVDVLKAQQQEAARTLDELRTALAKAERDLSFTVIRAPVDGVIGNRAVQTGDYVQTGQRLASLVPLDEVYVDANFKETQLAHLRPGQKVEISVDALPGQPIEGNVASLSPASGSVFSLLPPDNATGNFTKIVQRLPVRISVPLDVATLRVLRPGMSVIVSVNTKTKAEQDVAQATNP